MTVARGGYDDLFDKGKYYCAGCHTLLYTSEMKFDCGCGWPGYWDCVKGAVREAHILIATAPTPCIRQSHSQCNAGARC